MLATTMIHLKVSSKSPIWRVQDGWHKEPTCCEVEILRRWTCEPEAKHMVERAACSDMLWRGLGRFGLLPIDYKRAWLTGCQLMRLPHVLQRNLKRRLVAASVP